MTKRNLFYLFALSLILISCGGEDAPQQNLDMSLEDRVNLMIEQNEYEAALELLSEKDQTDPEIALLREKTHLNYGLHSMTTFDQTEMRTRMNNALSQFTEVLRINPDNTVAREQIQQILDIYATIPDRSPEEDVMEGLRDVGFDQ
jgi:tetratricopeptide (TPR) repeat protein